MNTHCPICGSENTVSISEITHEYKCRSCDAVFVPREPERPKPRKAVTSAVKTDAVLTPKEIYKKNIGSVFEIMSSFAETTNSGTGFYISGEGYIVTNSHVILDKSGDKPQFCEYAYAAASRAVDFHNLEIVYCDSECDLALLKNNEPGEYQAVEFARSEVEVGDEICTIGNIKGEGLAQFSGRVTDTERSFKGKTVFMHDALVAGGCSGGPVFNNMGKVCGVVVGGLPTVAGMNYALPLKSLLDFLHAAESAKNIKIN